MSWHIPATAVTRHRGLDRAAPGIPQEADYIRVIASAPASRMWTRCADWNFYRLTCSRIAAILQGIKRVEAGTAASAQAKAAGATARPMAELA